MKYIQIYEEKECADCHGIGQIRIGMDICDCPYEKKAEQKKKCIHNWVDIDKMESTFKCTKCKETLCIKFYPEKQEHKCVCKECANWQERGRG